MTLTRGRPSTTSGTVLEPPPVRRDDDARLLDGDDLQPECRRDEVVRITGEVGEDADVDRVPTTTEIDAVDVEAHRALPVQRSAADAAVLGADLEEPSPVAGV